MAEDAGARFPPAEIQDCALKKGIMGEPFGHAEGRQLPQAPAAQNGRAGGGMPRPAEYRKAVVARLSALSRARPTL